ncbi:alpha/beta hydrolase [Flavicella marina]|uniref:alpha/beta hydrolase n=1 Tax=Flavicella marina TaxID=1475951 RepID=UPI0012651324|nr:alpha/beta hydrolase [Flavicella marina]
MSFNVKFASTLIVFMIVTTAGVCQSAIIPLWNDEIPNSKKSKGKETYPEKTILWIENVQVPTLEVFQPAERQRTEKAIVICPGGGYHGLAYDWEGTDMAKWYNTKGITAFVLKYRLPISSSVVVSHEAPLQDAQRAIRYVRLNAKKYGVDKNSIGIMGSSAGGHLASTLGSQYDKKNNFKETEIDTVSARPDFMVLLYPVITMKEAYTHMGSRKALIGEKPNEELVEMFSNELQVTDKTPPTFIVHAQDDKAVPVENSLQFYKSLKEHNVPTEMHLYPNGGHGFSLAIGRGHLQTWTIRLGEWLDEL